MTALPPNGTPTAFLRYTNGFARHVTQFRFAPEVLPEDAQQMVAAFVDVARLLLSPDGVFDQLDYREANSDVTYPLPWSGVPGAFTSVGTLIDRPRFVSWVGRSTNGHKVRITMFPGVAVNPTNNYRLEPGEVTICDDVLTLLRGTSVDFRAIDAGQPIWKNYTNVGLNSYFQRKARNF